MATTVLERLAYQLGIDMKEFNSKIDGARGKLKGFSKSAKKIGAGMTAGITLPVVGMGAAILKFSGDFEAAMNGVKAVSGATEEEFKSLRDTAKELGATTKFSATEAALGVEMLARNGLKAEQILEGAAEASLRLASATGTNLANAADIATDTMAAFGIEAGDMMKAVDQITGVTVNSKFSIDDYRLAIAQAGGVAGSVGVEFDDFNAAIAAISPSFASGSDAGTSFKTFLQRLVPGSKEAATIMDELGINFFDAAGNMKSMGEIAGILQQSMGGLSEEMKIDVAGTLFGTDAMRAVLAFADAGQEGIETVKGLIAETNAAEQAATRMQGFSGAMKEMRSALENLAITIADTGLLELVTSIVKKFTDFTRRLAESNPGMLKWGIILAGIAVVLGPLIIAVGAIGSAIAAISAPIAAVIAGVAVLTTGFLAWGDSIGKVWGWIKKLLSLISGVGGAIKGFIFNQLGIGGGGGSITTSSTTSSTNVFINEQVSRSDISGIVTESTRQEDRG